MKSRSTFILVTLLLIIGQSSSITVNISLANHCNDLETTFTNSGVDFNRSAVNRIELRDVCTDGKQFFKTDYFRQFSSLLELHFENGNISSFPKDTFDGWNNTYKKKFYIPNSKSLSLINIGLENIPKGLLDPISNLQYLNVSYNILTQLPNDIFNVSRDLLTVDLSYNHLNHLPPDIFKPLTNITFLTLKNNSISSLHENIFSSQANLTELDLSFNDIQDVHNNTFGGLSKLKVLKISRAFNPNFKLAHVSPGLFWNMSDLETLEADQNNFQDLPEDTFSQLNKLQNLDLSSNNIASLSPKIFEKNVNLSKLTLKDNRLKALSDSLFRTLTNLTYLNLANNQLTFPQRTEIFSSQYKLKIIILDSNEKLDAAYNSSTSILYYCHLIQQISARKTNIKKIFEDWLSFEALEHLDLRDTLVGGKIRSNFTFASKNAQLLLKDSSNVSVDLSRSDSKFKKTAVLDKNQNCSTDCQCEFYIKDEPPKTIALQCENFDRKELDPQIPTGIRQKVLEGYPIEFYLSEQRTTLDLHLLTEYINQVGAESVRRLELEGNRLTDINALNHVSLPKLQILRLGNNTLERLNQTWVNNLPTTLTDIALLNNKWICSCETKYFSEFVKNNKNKIIQYKDVTCNDGTTSVADFDYEKACKMKALKETVVKVFIIFLGIIVAIPLYFYLRRLYRHYKFEMLSILNIYREYLPECIFPKVDAADDKKIFDAFVCYAKGDEQFVETRLVPTLENYSPYYKLCVHLRDWVAGDRINDQIYRSVKNSRRIIIVLSHNFLNSGTCQLEFRVARDQAIKDNVNRLIVIMLEDIAKHRLTEDLKAYITTYTYIPWQDNDRFWYKLRFALHDSRQGKTVITREDEIQNDNAQIPMLCRQQY